MAHVARSVRGNCNKASLKNLLIGPVKTNDASPMAPTAQIQLCCTQRLDLTMVANSVAAVVYGRGSSSCFPEHSGRCGGLPTRRGRIGGKCHAGNSTGCSATNW